MVEQLLERLTDIEPSQNVHLTSVNAMVQIIKKEWREATQLHAVLEWPDVPELQVDARLWRNDHAC